MLAQLVQCDSPDCGVEQRVDVVDGAAILPDGWIQTVLVDNVTGERRQMHFDTPTCMAIFTGDGNLSLRTPRLVTEQVQVQHRHTDPRQDIPIT